MITRYLKPILIDPATTTADFINVIVSAFVDLGFTEVTPILTTSSARSVQFENLKIDVYQNSSAINFKCYLYYDETNYYGFSQIISFVASNNLYSCNLCFFVSDDGKFVAFNVAGNTTQMGKGSGNVFYVITDNEEIAGVNTNPTNLICYSTNQYNSTVSLKRTYQKEENVFFKDEGVPVLKSSDNSYIMDLPYLTTLSGAEAQHTYTMTNGDNYYCLIDNIAVKFDTTVFPQTGT